MALDAFHDLCLGKAAIKQLFKATTDAELRAHYGRQEAEASPSPGKMGINFCSAHSKFLFLFAHDLVLDRINRFDAGASGGGLMEKLRGFAGADWHRVKQLTRAPRQGFGVVPITLTLPIMPTLEMWRSNYAGGICSSFRITSNK